MIVSNIVEDLQAALEEFPTAAGWRVGVATYSDGPGSDIDVMYAASFHTDADNEFFLVPEGLGEAFALEERAFSAQELLESLRARADWAENVAFVCSGLEERPDGSMAACSMPLWGTGIHQEAQLVYFYYGTSGPGA